MSTQPARDYLGISEVLAELRADFPDISVSKIRFLETEGLITPARSPAGYRRFCAEDVDRLRIILTAQRDEYLPLRVIKQRLDRRDDDRMTGPPGGASRPDRQAGRSVPAMQAARPGGTSRAGAGPAVPAMQAGADDERPGLSRRELVAAADLSDALVTELETFGLIRKIGRYYSPEALEVARTAKALTAFGVEARHLRAVRAAAERETTMIESLVAPILRQRGPGARELAARTARDCAALVLRLHCALVEGTLAEAGLPAGGLGQAAGSQHAGEALDRVRRQARGIEGASA
jgi:DNA-binding transcriptional MerR regulator